MLPANPREILPHQPKSKSPTIRDIAERIGISKSAVSLALRDDPRVASQTRKRVLKAAEQMGYTKNPTLAHLMAELRNSRVTTIKATLAAVNCSPNPDIFEWHTFRDFREGAIQRASQLGYGMDAFWLYEKDMRIERIQQIIRARNISGILFFAANNVDVLHDIYEPLWRSFPAATVGLVKTNPALTCVACDHFQTSKEAVEQALKLGYKRPGLVVAPDLDDLVDKRFSGGYLAAISGLPKKNQLQVHSSDLIHLENFRKWFQRNKPDVILSVHDVVHEWLTEMKLNIPKDVGLIHLDWREDIPEWAGMKQDNIAAGSSLVDLVVNKIHHNERGAQTTPTVTLIESHWIDGDTVTKQ
ncbi:LacI family DNA-binding transcriptional regulator [Rubellicoccus peritrichatus]|uniref:LacI family DNA-binding transcriptional regulator n=1 Tax=Rubellicoccus peritrichatus TaxID=3080537 RepID=A0AAQ3L8V0_9BACT|nr:LacI family DNA-binding transcriptional regulator [Puniceicoccus sp. CR14]WOO41789.1 LacI family DNA-binding transcriptional regulator [Puniceicoccus sp. CR14]